jgi:hypothetical protein
MLGKRKRKAPKGPESSELAEVAVHPQPRQHTEDAQAVFRKYFESQFKPIETAQTSKYTCNENSHQNPDEDGNGTEWSGLSEEDAGTFQMLFQTAGELLTFHSRNPAS